MWGIGQGIVGGVDEVQIGSLIYWVTCYAEGNQSVMKTTTTDINTRIAMVGPIQDCQNELITADGSNMYIAAFDAFSDIHTFVFAYAISNEGLVVFSNGTNYKPFLGAATQSMIAYKPSGALSSNRIRGLAVQQSHNFLFVSRPAINELQVVNKLTGLTVQTYTISSVGSLAVDGSDNLWAADGTNIKQYSVNSSTGALTATGVTIPLTNVGALKVSPNGFTITACDMTNQVVHAYRTSDGASRWTLGTGDYRTDATVLDNKFFWQDNQQQYFTSLCYLSDSSFFVADRVNDRIQHFSGDHTTFLESQRYIARPYYVYADAKNARKIYATFMQWDVDYTNSNMATRAVLAKNWGGTVTSSQDRQLNIMYPATFSNGRTYGWVKGSDYQLVELVSGTEPCAFTTIHKHGGSTASNTL